MCLEREKMKVTAVGRALGTWAVGRVEVHEQRQASSEREMGLERIRSV